MKQKAEKDMTPLEWLNHQEEKRMFKEYYHDRYGQQFNMNEDLEDDPADKDKFFNKRFINE